MWQYKFGNVARKAWHELTNSIVYKSSRGTQGKKPEFSSLEELSEKLIKTADQIRDCHLELIPGLFKKADIVTNFFFGFNFDAYHNSKEQYELVKAMNFEGLALGFEMMGEELSSYKTANRKKMEDLRNICKLIYKTQCHDETEGIVVSRLVA